MKRRSLFISIAFLVVLGALITTLLFHRSQPHSEPILPVNIHQQLSFVVIVPNDSMATIQRSTISYNKNSDLLSLNATYDATQMIITEQATPSIFSDVPQYYPNLISKLNEYDSIGTINGTVYLTKPKELGGQQQAVLNNDGTLVFIHPSKNLSNTAWQRFFNGLQVIKP